MTGPWSTSPPHLTMASARLLYSNRKQPKELHIWDLIHEVSRETQTQQGSQKMEASKEALASDTFIYNFSKP